MSLKNFIRYKLGLSGYSFQVPVTPKDYCIPDQCHHNSRVLVSKLPNAEIVSCWYIEKTALGYQAVYHSIVRSNGVYYDVTPWSRAQEADGGATKTRTTVLEPRFSQADLNESGAYAVECVTSYTVPDWFKGLMGGPRKLIDFKELF